MKNKKQFLIVLLFSLGLTTLGWAIDSDPANLNVWTTVFEYFAMLAITFTIVSVLYLVSTFLFRKLKVRLS